MFIEEERNTVSASVARKLGYITDLMLRKRDFLNYPMASLSAWIVPAIKLGQVKIYYGHDGTAIGCVTWAWLTPEVEHRWKMDPKMWLKPWEWNEGDSLWIISFITLPGLAKPLAQHIRATLFPDITSAKSLRRKSNGNSSKVVTWKRRQQ